MVEYPGRYKATCLRRADKSLAGQSGLQEEQLSFVLREVQEHRQGQATPPHRPAWDIYEGQPKECPKILTAIPAVGTVGSSSVMCRKKGIPMKCRSSSWRTKAISCDLSAVPNCAG